MKTLKYLFLLIFFHHAYSQQVDFVVPENLTTNFHPFLGYILPEPFIFEDIEEAYMIHYEVLKKVDNFIESLKPSFSQASKTAGDFARALLGLARNKDTDKIHYAGIYRQLRYFNIRALDDKDSYVIKGEVQRRDRTYENARHIQEKIQELEYLQSLCGEFVIQYSSIWLDPEFNFYANHKKMTDAILTNLTVKELHIFNPDLNVAEICVGNNPRSKKALENLKYVESSNYMLYMSALYIYFEKIVYALDFSSEGMFNGQQSGPPGSQLGTLELMISEVEYYGWHLNESIKEILEKYQNPQLSSKERAFYNRAYNAFVDTQKENNNELQMLYGKDTFSLYFDEELMQWRRDAVQDMKDIILDIGRRYLKYYDDVLEHDPPRFIQEFAANDSYKVYYHAIRDVYEKYLCFGEKSEFNFTVDNVEYTVGQFYSKSAGWGNYNKSNPIHNLYLAWYKLQRFSSKLRCFLNDSYWQFNRDAAAVNSQQPLTRLFGGISKTLFEPCSWLSDTDLVGTCTAENHEICRPMISSPEIMERIDKTSEKTFFKPDYVFNQFYHVNGTMECLEIDAHSVPLNLCRCGFRMDCGTDLGRNLTCVLEPNDNFRKQCRGSIGYPCKSHPLAPKRHHESCVTGYCDMEEDSCEKDPVRYPLVYSGQHRPGEF